MLYKSLLKPALFRFDPEAVHDFMTNAGESFGRSGLFRGAIESIYGYHGPDISKTVNGIRYRTPFLLSAGFDYNARLSRILPHIGLGGEEAGSITARACEGNPKPRLTRLPRSQSIIVNKGLRNEGVEAIIKRLKATPQETVDGVDFVRGISIARTNDQKTSELQAGIDDYAYTLRRLNEEGVGDYYTINISCPNAFGGEAFTKPELLNRLLKDLRSVICNKPIYIKMPINLPWAEFDALLRIADAHGIDGVVIGNLNKDYDSLEFRDEAPVVYKGGLSGKPCTHPSTDLIGKTRQTYGQRFTIMGVGGVMSPETAMEKFNAGADLVQLITGLIYEGPGLVRRMCKAYADSLKNR